MILEENLMRNIENEEEKRKIIDRDFRTHEKQLFEIHIYSRFLDSYDLCSTFQKFEKEYKSKFPVAV